MLQLTFDGHVNIRIPIPQVTHVTPRSPRPTKTSRLYPFGAALLAKVKRRQQSRNTCKV